ncbi:hypothetical protein Pmar_PMAR018514 [Perkinsus marinus ATCC 50983]|uniref:CCHC-type domain-containing protein n=1 Tax=Perkinsus marinus (strain ATCC 50983 / TXsc) TaxID=423536 RepID=C5L012_PERM5|nr:hypothetical protein Pmar_PMAR018514 [Perkinsus marinus ATCC 50983]EER09870.1 hypothetical protein Pmar_PMAR018514 [Perkinsus marinus ATCC 50983]|eukprot:XP_002778075.1 hypothetical protein Pmar_PMAR018514 [Perkinsus marinus ATCC 50983]
MNFETDALSDTMMESERAQRRLRRNEVTERMIAQSHDFVSIGDETDVAGVGDDQLGVATVVNSGLTEAGERVSASNQDYVSHAHNLPDPPHTTDDPSRGDSSGRGRPVGTLATTVQGLSPITIKNGSYGSSADALARKEARAELAVARFPVFVGNHRYKGSTVSTDEVWDKLITQSCSPYDDLALMYKLQGTSLMLARSYLVSRAKLVQQRSQSAGVALEATRIPFDSLASAAEDVSKSGGHGDSVKSVTGKVNSRSVNLKRLPTNACRRCFREGHLADACDSEMPTDISLRCLGCGFYGHKLSDCRMAKSRKLSCKRCSGTGHMSYICRQDRVVESQERRSADLTKSEEKAVPADGDQGGSSKKKSALLSVVEPTAPAASWFSFLNCTTGIEGLDDGPHDPLKANVSLRSYDVNVGDLEVSVMLDTGAGRSFIHKSVRDSLNSVYIRETRAISASATLADSTVMRFTEAIRVTIVTPQPSGAEAGVWLLVSPVLSCNMILGMNALRSLSLLVFVSSDATLLRASLTEVDVRRAISDSATRIMTCQDNPPVEEQPVDSSSSGCASPLPDDSSPSCCDFTSPDDCGMPELLYDTQLCRIVDGHDDVEGFNKFVSATMLNWGSKNTQDDLEQSPECNLATSSPSPSDDQSPCTLPPVFGDVGYGQSTVFVGLTPDRHVCSDGSTRMALRYTYDIPWLSNKRLPRPLKEDWARLFKKDAMLVQKLKKEGHFDAYDNVFRKYEDQGAMVEIPIKSDDFAQIDAVIPHFPVYAPSAVSTKVRPVINGIYYRGIIGNGRGDEDPKANTLRSTIPSLTVFRCYEHVYLSDLKMAFYQLANAPAAKYVFCIVWNSRVFRLRGPGMGAPHAPSCLQDAVCRLGKLSVAKLPIPISKKLESEKFGRKCICWKPYMDDVVLGATSRSLLDVAHTAFTSACDRRGFPFQPAKERDRPPAEGCPGSTTSFSTTS